MDTFQFLFEWKQYIQVIFKYKMSQNFFKEETSSGAQTNYYQGVGQLGINPTNTFKDFDINNVNQVKCKQYNILLTQSEKIIDKSRAEQINKVTKQDSQTNPTQRIERDPLLKQLRLQKGSSFWSLEDDYQTIYNNFNLLSYFSSSWGIQVLSRKSKANGNQIQIEQQFLLKRQQNCKMTLVEINRDKFKKSGILRIQYELTDGKNNKRKIQVLIESQTRMLTDPQQYLQHTRKQRRVAQRFRQFIKIKIVDFTGWIAQKRNLEQRHHRVSELRKAKVWETEYFYIEPSDERHKIISGEHISLALQGGGCKGVQYIGAYRAILQSKQNVNIKSVIGSSAGGIIGLAICCKLAPNDILDICVELLSKVTNDKKYKYKDTEFIKKTFDEMMKFMKTINIFEEKIIDKIMTWLKDEEFQSLFLKVILANTNPEVYKLFISDKKKDKKDDEDQLNMTGLFKAEMMTGSIIRQIAITCICMYLSSLQSGSNQETKKQIDFLKKKYAKFSDQQKESKLKYSYIGQNLTMKELYNLTGIQFTCTAVDIDNHVLRFFNQKTTPDLPACYAVQMTGSFPVAFEAQTWKKQWGKYYVHYENMRKQINITGCRITDGGTLANFPVKYLDNEDMRPMYFSHAKTKDTVIYGLGLKTYITETQAQKQAKQEAGKNLANYISNHISKFTVLRSWIKQKATCCFKPEKRKIDLSTNPFQAFSNIPLIDFVINLLLTYSTSKDNLTQQCFQQSSYQTIAGQSYVNEVSLRPSQKQLAKQIFKIAKMMDQNIVIEENSIKSTLIDNFENFKQATFANYLSQNYLCDIQTNLQQNSAILLHCIENNLNSQQKNQLKKTISDLIKNSFDKNVLEQIINTKNKKEQKDLQYKIENVFQFIRNMTEQKQFVLCSIQEDLKNLEFFRNVFLNLIDKMKNLYGKSKPQQLGNKDSLYETVIKQIRDQEYLQLEKIKSQLRTYADKKTGENQTQDKWSKQQKKNGIDSVKNSYFVDRKMILLLQKLPSLTMTLSLKQIKKIIYQIQHSSVPQFFINFEAQDNKNLIKSYTLNRIAEETAKIRKLQNTKENNKNEEFLGIHLVLESVPLSEMYFHEYYRIVKETIIEYNEGVKKKLAQEKQPIAVAKNKNDANNPPQFEELKQVKVTTMTATGYHSLIMFLYASDLSEERVSQQVWKIRDLIKLNQKQVISKYENKDWAKITPILLREFQKQAEKNKKNIFEEIKQANMNKDTSKTIENVAKNIRKQVDQVRFSNDEMNEAIQNSLNYIVGKVMKYEGKKDTNEEVNAVKIRELMSELVIDLPKNRFETENEEVAAQLKKLSTFFLDKFEDILKYMFYQSPRLVDKIVNSLRPEQRKVAWRGILLSQILSGRQIKDYVKSILVQLNFKPETTLKQFYEYSEKKIQLNFSVVQQNFVAIYNHISRPNIPLWAAILASASIPQFYSPLVTRPEWTSKFEINHNRRQVEKYFRSPPSPYRLLTSSQTLTRLPLDLLRNNKLKTMLSNRQNEVFLIFNFSEYQLPNIGKNVVQSLSVAPLTLGEIVSKFVSLKKQVFGCNDPKSEEAMNAKALGMLAKLPTITSKLESLSLYIQSHDNLILKLYKAELVQFPIRFDTLDFDKMTVVENGKQRLSDICCDAIMQAHFILSQKISSNYSGQNKNSSIVASKPVKNSIKNIKDQKEQKLMSNTTKKQGKQKSKRQIYFRVQSVSKNQLKQKRKQYYQFINKPSKENTQQSFNESILNLVSNLPVESVGLIFNQQREFKTLKIRFLSILNPSRKTYQKYYIYYKQNQNQEYKRVQTEQVFVTQNKDNQKIHLKIQFPNSQLTSKKTRWLILDLKQLFQLSKKQDIKFGFVYKLNFDGLYSKLSIQQQTYIESKGKLKIFNKAGGKPINPNRLQPQDIYKQDYMNRNQFINPTPIYIKSDISNINYKAILCEYCVTEVEKVKKQDQKVQKDIIVSPATKNKSPYIYMCLNQKCAKKFSQITDKYKVQFDYKKQIYKCAMNHKLQISESFSTDNTSNGDDKSQRSCDLCGRVNFSKLWKDKICNIMICDDCKNNKLEEKSIDG